MFAWFHHSDPDEPKKEGPFTVAWLARGGRPIASAGLEISPSGLVFTTSFPPPEKEFNIDFEVRGKPLHARVTSKKPLLVSTPTGLQHKFDCKFVGIAADDWDCIVRYINDIEEIINAAPLYDPNKADDEFRQLPSAVQGKIIDDLVRKERLDRPADGAAPLISMVVQGEQRSKDGKRTKKYMIHSRVVIVGEEAPKDFDTKYTIDELGTVIPQG